MPTWETSDGKRFDGRNDSEAWQTESRAKAHQEELDKEAAKGPYKYETDSKQYQKSADRAAAEYYFNEGTKHFNNKDWDSAIKFFTFAINKRSTFAPGDYFMRANSYFNKQDYKNAIDDYTEALKQGFENSYPNEAKYAKEYLAEAQQKLGGNYTPQNSSSTSSAPSSSKEEREKKDKENDAKWFEANKDKAKEITANAKNGGAEEWYKMGDTYEMGKGVPKDLKEAVKWYRKAAEQGHKGAQYTLGTFYGKLLLRKEKLIDYDEAVMWLGKSSEQGYDLAEKMLNKIKEEGKPKKGLFGLFG